MLINMLYIIHEGNNLPTVQVEKAVHQLEDSTVVCQIEHTAYLAFSVWV